MSGKLSADDFRKLSMDKNFKPLTLAEMKEKDGVVGEILDNSKKDEKDLHSGGESSILYIMSDQIESRRDGVGVPSDIYKHRTPLDDRQQRLLDKLPEYDSRVTVDKSEVSMMDLSALTAKEGVEFAMFTCGSKRLVVRGAEKSVNVSTRDAVDLQQQGYRWSGHTHPGNSKIALRPSSNDKAILKAFGQPTSVIYNSVGQYQTFVSE